MRKRHCTSCPVDAGNKVDLSGSISCSRCLSEPGANLNVRFGGPAVRSEVARNGSARVKNAPLFPRGAMDGRPQPPPMSHTGGEVLSGTAGGGSAAPQAKPRFWPILGGPVRARAPRFVPARPAGSALCEGLQRRHIGRRMNDARTASCSWTALLDEPSSPTAHELRMKA